MLCAALLCAAASAAPLEVYGRLPAVEDMAISPDGSRLAYVKTVEDERIVAIISLPERGALGAFKVGTERIRNMQWADDHRLLITTSLLYSAAVLNKTTCDGGSSRSASPAQDGTGLGAGSGATRTGPASTANFTTIVCVRKLLPVTREWSMLQVYDVNTHVSTGLPDPAKVREVTLMNVIAGAPMVRSIAGRATVIVPGYFVNKAAGQSSILESTDSLLPLLIRVDLDSGNETVMQRGSADTRRWLVNADGGIVAEEDYLESRLGRSERWTLKVARNGRLEESVSGNDSVDHPRLLGLGPLPDTLLLQSVEDGAWNWKTVSIKEGPPATTMSALTSPMESRTTYRIIGGVRRQDDSRYVFFDPSVQARWDSLVLRLGASHVQLVSMTDDFGKAVVRAEGPRVGYRYQLVDLAAQKAEPIADVYAGVSVPLETKSIVYAAADGLQIPAYLTLPRNRDPKNLALIVLPHGEVAGADTADFDWWSQALAEQGYAVLRPNFRGSNLDHRFLVAGYGEWGRKMQTDLSDGVRFLVSLGIADPHRVCIVGANYGGYAALAGVSLDPGVYRCAAAIEGISDLGRWQKSQADQGVSIRFVNADNQRAPLGDISPITHVEAIQVPVLLMHGEDDPAVPFEQSQRMADAMRRAGKSVDLVRLPHEDSLLSSSEARSLMLQRSVEFLRLNNPPD